MGIERVPVHEQNVVLPRSGFFSHAGTVPLMASLLLPSSTR